MKKIITTLTFLFVLLFSCTIKVFALSTPPQVASDGVVLMDGTTGTVLYSKNMDVTYPPASTTKIMTMLLTLEKCKLDEKVTVGKNPPQVAAGTSNVSLVEGEQITVKDLLYGLVLQSGNDCAETLAEHIGGTSQHFAEMMNARAKELHCEDTNFVNPSGLYNANHKTSAKDLALIMRELVKHPMFKEIANTKYYVIPPNNKFPKGHPMSNENKIVNNRDYYMDGYEGSKTGYTTESQFSFVISATRNGQRLIVALVHSKQATYYADAENLLNYGFQNYELVKLYNKGDKVLNYKINNKLTVPLLANEDYYYVKEKNSKDNPTIKYDKVNLNNKSFKAGENLLTVNFLLGNKQLNSLKLNSGITHTTKKHFNKNNISEKKIFIGIASILIIATASLFILRAFIKKKNYKKRKDKKITRYLYE